MGYYRLLLLTRFPDSNLYQLHCNTNRLVLHKSSASIVQYQPQCNTPNGWYCTIYIFYIISTKVLYISPSAIPTGWYCTIVLKKLVHKAAIWPLWSPVKSSVYLSPVLHLSVHSCTTAAAQLAKLPLARQLLSAKQSDTANTRGRKVDTIGHLAN